MLLAPFILLKNRMYSNSRFIETTWVKGLDHFLEFAQKDLDHSERTDGVHSYRPVPCPAHAAARRVSPGTFCSQSVATGLLDANLPGKRAPNTYDNDMQMAHRGGRLTRD